MKDVGKKEAAEMKEWGSSIALRPANVGPFARGRVRHTFNLR